MNASAARVVVATAASPGAVAIIQIHGPGAPAILARLTHAGDWAPGRLRLVKLGGIDEGFAVVLGHEWVQLMPHGGPHVVRKLVDRLLELGAVHQADPPAREVYPEAASDLEADMLATLARAASPAAIDLLLEQPRLWRDLLPSAPGSAGGANIDGPWNPPAKPGAAGNREIILRRSNILDRLVDPPSVVVVGRPNVGKSTLTNRMLGRAASVVADLPGTTRDWVAGLAEIPIRSGGGVPGGGVAVRWMDTPGLRRSDDAIERRAIELAGQVIREADVLISMRDPVIGWPELPRPADLCVVNKSDVAAVAGEADALRISAATGAGVDELERAVVRALGLGDEALRPGLWAFSRRLRELVASGDGAALRGYAGG